jgi:uncharacterized protein (UPF0248 family)
MSRAEESTLFIHDEEIKSIFQLLGEKENALSYSLGYALSKSPRFLKAFIDHVWRKKFKIKEVVIKLQESGEKGYTDFEIVINNEYKLIIEAKKGWVIPDKKQIKKYLNRFKNFDKKKRLFVVLSDCKESYFRKFINDTIHNVPIRPMTWQNALDLIDNIVSRIPNKEKVILKELRTYFEEVINMETKDSNRVYVVSLSQGTRSWSKISWIDVIEKKHHYFYPNEKNWPHIPPNYMAFRYNGILQSINHVEKYEVVEDMHDYIPEIKKGKMKNHFLLWLGPKFEPRKVIPNGKIWPNGRCWCQIDTLFTSKTIKEAARISNKRENKN